MSTYDVPGHNPMNNDELTPGCWAEHEDGSMIFVEGIESGKVIYSMFDLETDPPMEYRDAMPEKGFKKHFSWDPNNKNSEPWLWKDKTSFPWDTVMGIFKDGTKFPSALDQINAAKRVADAMVIKGKKIEEDSIANRLRNFNAKSKVVVGRKGKVIMDKIQRAIGELRV